MRGLRVDPGLLASLPDGERELVAGELERVERAFRENPLLGYRPHARQVEFHRPALGGVWLPARFFFGGNRSGKTTGGMVDTILQAVDREFVPEHLRGFKRWEPPFKCRIMTPDFGDTHEVVLEKIREWCPRGALKGGSFDRAFDKQKKVLWFKNGSRFHFNSNVQDREQLGGSDLHRVLYDEEPRQDLRTESLTRLIDHDGEEIFCMTPLEGMSWLYDEIYEPWEHALSLTDDLGELELELGMRVLVVDMDDNPHLNEDGKRRALAAYPEHEREARKTGRFVSFSGLIYPSFSARDHVLPTQVALPASERFVATVPPGVEVFVGIDPGYRHMCAVVFCYLDDQDRLVVFDEIAASQATIRVVCEEIRARCRKWGVQPRWYVIDPASRNKVGQTGRSDAQEFSDNGIVTIPGQNAVRAGINRVLERIEFRNQRGDLEPRLLVAAHCTELRAEFKKYRWVKDSHRREGEAKEAPVKKDDHLLDALRYVVMQRPLAPDRELLPPTATQKDRLLRRDLARMFRDARRPALVDHPSGPGLFQ